MYNLIKMRALLIEVLTDEAANLADGDPEVIEAVVDNIIEMLDDEALEREPEED
ncbi:MAG: hypothetical protein NVS9B9_27660 [Ktedonobacteraceae bacterium]